MQLRTDRRGAADSDGAATADRRRSSQVKWIMNMVIIAMVTSLACIWKLHEDLFPAVDDIHQHRDFDHDYLLNNIRRNNIVLDENDAIVNVSTTTTKSTSAIQQDVVIPEYDEYEYLPDLRDPAVALDDMFGSTLPYVRGNRSWYTPAPEDAWDKFVVIGKAEDIFRRIFKRKFGWTEVGRRKMMMNMMTKPTTTTTLKRSIYFNPLNIVVARNQTKEEDLSFQQAWLYYRHRGASADERAANLLPYQRFGRVPGYSARWESKDKFLNAFRKYSIAQFEAYKKRQESIVGIGTSDAKGGSDADISHPDDILWFLPPTYRITQDEKDRQAFLDRLAGMDNNNVSGMDYPWVLKKATVNNGQGIEMLPPNSEALRTAVDRVVADKDMTYVVQQYICNELTWFQGQKFDFRNYWMVASVDPLIVLFEDGYVRPGSKYDENSWNTTGQHLTNHAFRTESEQITNRHFHKLIQDHYDQNQAKFRSKEYGNIVDPVRHVRNQMKESIAHLVAATKDGMIETIKSAGHREENNFAIYGCDFILDDDLDVWFIEAQTSPAVERQYRAMTDTWDRISLPMFRTVEEIARKQQHDASANLLPLENLGGWEFVYVQDTGFRYTGYKRSKNKKPCRLPRI